MADHNRLMRVILLFVW